ncbi:hypothetical protein KDA08_02530 [Candidatus Saccharibacteria bacterium]|nr:hypothetical protein [Candidatus Saccharibacteria bacterium]
MFDPDKFSKKISTKLDNIADEWAKSAADIIKEDLEKRLDAQLGYKGTALPKKKYPRKSRDPQHFLVDTGVSTKLSITKSGKGSYTISAQRPNILNYPNPHKGLVDWWGVPKALNKELRSLLNKIIKKWVKK